jgi:hypothetical protein
MRELTHLHSRLLTSRLLVTTRICVSQLKHLAAQGKTEARVAELVSDAWASLEMPAKSMPRLSFQESSPSFFKSIDRRTYFSHAAFSL